MPSFLGVFLATKGYLGEIGNGRNANTIRAVGEGNRGAGRPKVELAGITALAFWGNPGSNLADGAGVIYGGVVCHPLRVGGRGKGVAVGDGCQAGKGILPSLPFFRGSMPQKTGSEPALWRASVAAGWLCSLRVKTMKKQKGKQSL